MVDKEYVLNNLPKEFDFRSNVNSFDILYHAKETEQGYDVTCDCNDCKWKYTKAQIRGRLINGSFEIVY